MKSNTQKIILIGYPNSGKTSLKKFFFDHMNDEQILNYPIEPTIGYDITFYQYLDIQFNIFDTSGQELSNWFESQNDIFYESDKILFLFTIFDWNSNPDLFNSYIQKIFQLMKKLNLNIENILFVCHKSDLILPTQFNIQNEIRNNIQKLGFQLFFTSIKLRWKSDIFKIIQYIISSQSTVIQNIINNLSNWINEQNIIPIAILDCFNNVICEFERDESINEIYEHILKENSIILQMSLQSSIGSRMYVFEDKWFHEIFVCIILHPSHKDFGLMCLKVKDFSIFDSFFSYIQKQFFI